MTDDLYFVRAGEFVKIGRTRNLQARLVSIQTGCPFPIESSVSFEGMGAQERDIHRKLAAHHFHGEWFRRGSAVEAQISLIRDHLTSQRQAVEYLTEIAANGTNSPRAVEIRREARQRLLA